MIVDNIQTYLHLLERDMRLLGIYRCESLVEVESHLLDSLDQGLRSGLSPEKAAITAIHRFGSPLQVAYRFLKESFSMKQKILLACSTILGLLIAYIDSRPTWDDTGLTVFALLAIGGVIGLLLQKRPWLYALAFGIWLPLTGIIFRHDWMMLIVLAFPFIGVYAGWLIKQLFTRLAHST